MDLRIPPKGLLSPAAAGETPEFSVYYPLNYGISPASVLLVE